MWSFVIFGMIGFVLILLFVTLFLVAPGKSTAAQRAPFMNRTYAHRGLYQKDQSIPENSLAAFAAAKAHGYGVELDVQLTSDKQIVVFHDASLLRACGVDARVDSKTYAETQQMPLFGTEHRMPLFSEVLREIDGAIPMIVELKSGGDWRGLCERALEMLRSYEGPFCVESFDPFVVQWFRKNAPDILRGQLSEQHRYSKKTLPLPVSFAMSRLLTNVFVRPQFIAYRVGPRPFAVRLCEKLGVMRVTWTAQPTDDHAVLTRENDAVIFEHYLPPVSW